MDVEGDCVGMGIWAGAECLGGGLLMGLGAELGRVAISSVRR